MKNRIVDKLEIRGKRKETDETWDHFANCLFATFSDTEMAPEYFEQIYTTQRMRKFDERFMDSIIYNIPPAFVPFKHLFDSDSEKSAYPHIKGIVMDWKGSEEAPLFLLGYVGTGKTTFLKYSFGLKNKLRKDCKIGAAIVNFKVAPSTPDRMLLFIIDSLNTAIDKQFPEVAKVDRQTFNKLFKDEILGLENTIVNKRKLDLATDELLTPFTVCVFQGHYENIVKLVKKKISFLSKNKLIKDFWLILDNIDQHYYCLHQRVLISAVALSYDIGCPLIISMRYITLNSPEARDVYASYFPRKLNLSLPDVTSLLQKRAKLLAEELIPFSNIKLKLTGYQNTIADLWNDLEKVLGLLPNSNVLMDFMFPLSNFNMRRLLQMVLNCFQSYYFYFDYFNAERYLPTKDILFKRILFSHCLKNQDYYDPASDDEETFVVNLFENENPSVVYNQTIRIRMLQALQSFGRSIELGEFVKILKETFKYENIDILRAMRAFLKAQLFAVKGVVDEDFNESIFLEGLKEDDLNSNDMTIAFTYAGRVHLELMYVIEYIEIMKFSTYVPIKDFYIIQDQTSQRSFSLRKKGIRSFVKYLANEELEEEKSILLNNTYYMKYFGKFSNLLIHRVEEQIRRLEKIQARSDKVVKGQHGQ